MFKHHLFVYIVFVILLFGSTFTPESFAEEQNIDLNEIVRLAEQGDTQSQFNLGFLYEKGEYVQQNYSEAIKWYKKAAEKGNVDAAFNLGAIYFLDRPGSPKNYQESFKWYQQAAQQGDAQAQARVGGFYQRGLVVSKDSKEAAKWYEMSAKQDDVEGLIRLGVLYKHGQGVPHDPKKAIYLLSRAAVKGSSQAELQLAILYETEVGEFQNYSNAYKWFKTAVDHGNAEAQYFLGTAYLAGNGTVGYVKNSEEGLKLLYEARAGTPESSKFLQIIESAIKEAEQDKSSLSTQQTEGNLNSSLQKWINQDELKSHKHLIHLGVLLMNVFM